MGKGCRLSDVTHAVGGALAVVLASAALVTAGAATPAADVVFRNGTVRTQDPARHVAHALAVSAGRIIYVGDDDGVARYVGASTRVVDLAGRTLLPGLADAHVHPALGEFLNHRLCNVRAFSVAEGLQKLRACAARAPAGDWVVGYGWYDLDNAAFDLVTRR